MRLIWGWRLPDGQADTDKVEQELLEPGSQCTPAEIRRWQEHWLQQTGWRLSPEEIAAAEAVTRESRRAAEIAAAEIPVEEPAEA